MKTKLYKYLDELIDLDNPYKNLPWEGQPILRSVYDAFMRTPHYKVWYMDDSINNKNFAEVFLEWSSHVRPQDLELDFNPHQIIELFLEEE